MTTYIALDGARLHREMQMRGLTLKQLAEESKTSLQTVRRGLDGKEMRSANAALIIKAVEAHAVVDGWEKYIPADAED